MCYKSTFVATIYLTLVFPLHINRKVRYNVACEVRLYLFPISIPSNLRSADVVITWVHALLSLRTRMGEKGMLQNWDVFVIECG